jgi:hypothetical protein
MLVRVPDHFSTNFKFTFKGLPERAAKACDRASITHILFGFIFGLMLLALGCFELLSFLTVEDSMTPKMFMYEIFSIVVIVIGFVVVAFSVVSFIRYKKFIFDGRVFHITYRPALGVKQRFSEPLENYVGIRLRVLFTQVGLINKNKYVIDLFHYDANKIIPLYISTINIDIRKIWEAYAKMFKLPALSVGDRGLVQRDFNDLNKSIKELATENKLPYIVGGKFPAPNSLNIEETGQSTIVKPTGIYWDFINKIYLSLSAIISIILTSAGVYMTLSGKLLPTQYLAYGAIMLLLAIYFLTKLFKSYRLDIYEDRIVITKMLFDSPLKVDAIFNKDIESVELGYDSTMDRYNISIIADNKAINFGVKLPINDLLWLKDFITRKLIGN